MGRAWQRASEAALSKKPAPEASSAIGLDDLCSDAYVNAIITQANEHLRLVGYTEHGHRHAGLVANIARNIMLHLEMPAREAEIAAMAAYLHDIGNVVARDNHWTTGAAMALEILRDRGMDTQEALTIANAIGNHEEFSGDISSAVTAAVVIADKSDVHRSRVQNPDPATYDVHDRVNQAVERSFVRVDLAERDIVLELKIDSGVSSVMEYFEIFLSRMVMCRNAAGALDCTFALVMNDQQLA